MSGVVVRELPLDLDAFQGPFDLLLTLVLREELELPDVEIAEIVLAFVERLAERDELDLEACGEFLVLVSALLELKARGLFRAEEPTSRISIPRRPPNELAERLAAYRRFRAAARLARGAARDRVRPLVPHRPGAARAAPRPPPLPPQDPALLAVAFRRLAAEPPAPSLRHLGYVPAAVALPRALPGAPHARAAASPSTRRSTGSRASSRPSRSSPSSSCASAARRARARRPLRAHLRMQNRTSA